MVKMTSAQANKVIRSLKREYETVKQKENELSVKKVFSTDPEDMDVNRYDLLEMAKKLSDIVADISAIRHAVNTFNNTYVLPGLDMTIDTALYLLPVLTQRRSEYDMMRTARETRDVYGNSNVIVTRKLMYDLKDAADAFYTLDDKINKIQLALDLANATQTFEVPIQYDL